MKISLEDKKLLRDFLDTAPITRNEIESAKTFLINPLLMGEWFTEWDNIFKEDFGLSVCLLAWYRKNFGKYPLRPNDAIMCIKALLCNVPKYLPLIASVATEEIYDCNFHNYRGKCYGKVEQYRTRLGLQFLCTGHILNLLEKEPTYVEYTRFIHKYE